MRHTFARDAKWFSQVEASRDFNHHLPAADRRHFDFFAQQEIDDAHFAGHNEVRTLPLKDRMRANANTDIEVTRSRAAFARFTGTLDLDELAIFNARQKFYLNFTL